LQNTIILISQKKQGVHIAGSLPGGGIIFFKVVFCAMFLPESGFGFCLAKKL